jgi:hypothetical protein
MQAVRPGEASPPCMPAACVVQRSVPSQQLAPVTPLQQDVDVSPGAHKGFPKQKAFPAGMSAQRKQRPLEASTPV